MKKNFRVLAAGLLLFGIMPVSQATMIDSESPITNPASTNGLWSYSYFSPNPVISGSSFYYTSASQYAGAVHQGYVTGDYGPWSPNNDSFSLDPPTTGYKGSHIFETYVMSSIDQTVRFATGGDDGHSIFVNDTFTSDLVTVSGVDYAAGAGFAVTALRYLDMVADTPYKITLAGANYGGPWSYWFGMSGETEQGETWGGPVSEAYNISMNATGDFEASVPAPVPFALMGLGILALGYTQRR